MKETTYNITLL